jgi:hypothetical protein
MLINWFVCRVGFTGGMCPLEDRLEDLLEVSPACVMLRPRSFPATLLCWDICTAQISGFWKRSRLICGKAAMLVLVRVRALIGNTQTVQ